MEYSKMLWLCIFLIYHVANTDAQCNCPKVHPQTKYCTADFVIEGVNIKGVGVVPMTLRYDISMGLKIKLTNGASNVLTGGVVRVFSKIKPCGVVLNLFKQYFITGRISQSAGRAYTTKCDFVKERTTMTSMEVQGMLTDYEKGCECTIKNCWNNNQCNSPLSPDDCRIDRRKLKGCHDLHGVCTRDSNGVCRWNDNYVPLIDCLNTP